MQTKRGLLIHGVFVFRHADASLQSSLLSYFQTWRDFTTAERSAKPLDARTVAMWLPFGGAVWWCMLAP